jgi:hypothetical protein
LYATEIWRSNSLRAKFLFFANVCFLSVLTTTTLHQRMANNTTAPFRVFYPRESSHEWAPHTREVFRFGLTPTINVYHIEDYEVDLLDCLEIVEMYRKIPSKKIKSALDGRYKTSLSLHPSKSCSAVLKQKTKLHFRHIYLMTSKTYAETSCLSTSVLQANFAR